MVTRLRVQGFKSLLDVDVVLAPLVVIFGPNAVGKSNFLEALVLLSRLVTERTLSDAINGSLRGYPVEVFSLPMGGLQGLLAQESAELSIEADIQPGPLGGARPPDALRYRATVRVQPKSGALTVADELLSRLKKDGSPKHKPLIEREGDYLTVRQLGRLGREWREPIGLSQTVASNPQLSGEERFPDFDRLRRELFGWKTFYLGPRSDMREQRPPSEVEDIGSRGELLAPFLYRLKMSPDHRRAFIAVGRALHTAIPTVDGFDVDFDPNRGILDIVISQDRTPYSSRVVSEGTLRVLALCALAANPWARSLVAFEEPESGVHPRRLDVIGDLLVTMGRGGRQQVIVTTHSPALLAAMLRRQQEPERGSEILLLRCSQEDGATRLRPLDPQIYKAVLKDPEIEEWLSHGDAATILENALLRGWLDG